MSRHRLPPFSHPHSGRRYFMDSDHEEQFEASRGSGGNNGAPLDGDSSFDVLEWFPAYQSCQRYLLDHSQHEPATQALCALINIRLPYQWAQNPIPSSKEQHSSTTSNASFTFLAGGNAGGGGGGGGGGNRSNINSPSNTRPQSRYHQQNPSQQHTETTPFVSLVPYIRRLVVTAFDQPAILHGFFGDEYIRGVMPHIECERRNYLFAAKHGGWRSCKKQYDNGSGGGPDESVPFMKPLDRAKLHELKAADNAWSGWLAMEDWMVGPRAPSDDTGFSSSQSHSQRNRHEPHDFPDDMPDGIPRELAPHYADNR